MRIGLSLEPHDLRRLVAAIAAEHLPAKVVDGVLELDEALGHGVEVRYERLMRLNRAIHDRARRAGTPIQPYKPLDRVNLLLAVLAAPLGDEAALAHEVIWRQPFANANHRTAIAAVEEALGLNVSAAQLQGLDPILRRSKDLLDGSDTSKTNEQAKQEHAELAREMVVLLQSRS